MLSEIEKRGIKEIIDLYEMDDVSWMKRYVRDLFGVDISKGIAAPILAVIGIIALRRLYGGGSDVDDEEG